MDTKTFLENFGHIADAPNGVQKLRELILELSIQGKLTAQNANEESGHIVFERNQKEREKLIESGEIKRQKNLPEIDAEEIPFNIPEAWKWCRLGEVTNYGVSDKADPTDLHDDTWVLELEDVEKITSKLLQKVFYKDRQSKSTKSKFLNNDVIYGKLRPYLDKVIVANEDGVCTTEMIPVRGYFGLVPEYLRWVMKSPFFISYADNSTHGMNLPRLGTDKGRAALFPLPPLEEQKRIVAKADHLMAICDKLETQQKQKAKTRVALNNAALDKLLTAQNPDEFNHHWQRIANNFHYLYDNLENLISLRTSIIELAVRGKLIPQKASDESAKEMLKRVEKEKLRIYEQKNKKERWEFESLNTDDEPYPLPSAWVWARIINTAETVTVGYVGSMTKEYVSSGVPFLRTQNVRQNRYEPIGLTYISREFHKKISKSSLEPNDVVVVRSGNVGTACVIPSSMREANCSDLVIIKQPLALLPKYISYYVNSAAKQHVSEGTVGIALTHYNTKSVAAMPIPVPPVEEQKRIVAKVDQLTALCDQLETKLKQTHTTSESLVEATVKSLLAA